MTSDVDRCADIEVEPERDILFNDDIWDICNTTVDGEGNSGVWIDVWSVLVEVSENNCLSGCVMKSAGVF